MYDHVYDLYISACTAGLANLSGCEFKLLGLRAWSFRVKSLSVYCKAPRTSGVMGKDSALGSKGP